MNREACPRGRAQSSLDHSRKQGEPSAFGCTCKGPMEEVESWESMYFIGEGLGGRWRTLSLIPSLSRGVRCPNVHPGWPGLELWPILLHPCDFYPALSPGSLLSTQNYLTSSILSKDTSLGPLLFPVPSQFSHFPHKLPYESLDTQTVCFLSSHSQY